MTQQIQQACCCGPGSCLTDCVGCANSFRVRVQGLHIQCTFGQTLITNCQMPVAKNLDPNFPCMWWNPSSSGIVGDCAFATFGNPKLQYQLRCGTSINLQPSLPVLPDPRWVVYVFIPNGGGVCGSGTGQLQGLLAYTRGSPQTCPQLGVYTFWAANIGGTLLSPGTVTLEAA